ncbi:mitochondrial protein Pet127-domain-containing protein [Cantharellus anzutake]|uniref:mitochondrial protein Pet127-domain-containing protein n=1 Tax=Cantharellus anzutake TaxID=1750568 RepID=UPI001907A105|nr:mitochondrial protein Pet127-domain-containing protein [Cantharellus anzutake]KAF8340535.1 mitochondrial protein Pet127-domain-containing protein [Cantharellus anzutake]
MLLSLPPPPEPAPTIDGTLAPRLTTVPAPVLGSGPGHAQVHQLAFPRATPQIEASPAPILSESVPAPEPAVLRAASTPTLPFHNIRSAAMMSEEVPHYMPQRWILRMIALPGRVALCLRRVVIANVQAQVTLRIWRSLRHFITTERKFQSRERECVQILLEWTKVQSAGIHRVWNSIGSLFLLTWQKIVERPFWGPLGRFVVSLFSVKRSFLDVAKSIKKSAYPPPSPSDSPPLSPRFPSLAKPAPAQVVSVIRKAVERTGVRELPEPDVLAIARLSALRSAPSLNIPLPRVHQVSRPPNVRRLKKAFRKTGSTRKEDALVTLGINTLQCPEIAVPSTANASGSLYRADDEDSYLQLYPELSASAPGTALDDLGTFSSLSPLKTKEGLPKEAWQRVRRCKDSLNRLITMVRGLELRNESALPPNILQALSVLQSLIGHVQHQALDAIVRHVVFQAMMGRVQHLATADRNGHGNLASGLFLPLWQLLKHDAVALKKMMEPDTKPNQPSFKSVERQQLTPRSVKTTSAVNSFSSFSAKSPAAQLKHVRERIFGEFTSQEVLIKPISRNDAEPPIPRLAHQLDRVLFNPAPYMLQDFKTGVYNFDSYLQTIPPVQDFSFDKISSFVPSSQHTELQRLAHQLGKSFVGSTSSLTPLLSHMYFLLSRMKWINTTQLSSNFTEMLRSFTPAATMPAGVIIHHKDGVYSTDSDNLLRSPEAGDTRNILAKMGTMLEYFLTSSPDEFSQLGRHKRTDDTVIVRRNAFQYTETNGFVMRSQLDCHDPRLPGTGVFDIKTRAVVAIRLDLANYEENSSYLIKSMTGQYSSFERELYDLMRSALLKYNFQARIGAMSGIFIAYHNTSQIQGFQYMSLAEMDQRLFGHHRRGDNIFAMCVGLLEHIMKAVLEIFPKQSKRVLFETLQSGTVTNVYIEPLEWANQGPRPVHELTVLTRVYSNNRYDSTPDFDSSNWKIQYMITHFQPSVWTRRNFSMARSKALSIGLPPSDHSASPQFDANDSSSQPSSITPMPRPRTSRPRGIIPHLRRIAQRDRAYLEKLKQAPVQSLTR